MHNAYKVCTYMHVHVCWKDEEGDEEGFRGNMRT